MKTSRTYILFIYFTITLIYFTSAQELLKHTAQDLLVTRVKKNNDLIDMEPFYKQKPQFFVGVKGKKNSYEKIENGPLYYKPVTMRLVKLRNQKEYVPSEVFPIGQNNYYKELNNIRSYLKNYQHKLQRQNSEADRTEVSFNTPTNENRAFMSDTDADSKRTETIYQYSRNRGKKSIPSRQPYDLTFRWKFIGVRGKKDTKTGSSDQMPYLLDQSRRWPKRKTQMGFVGMRGKKWTDDDEDESSTEMDTTH